MLELHDKPNDSWYARITAAGKIELNPADTGALEKLRRNHAHFAAAFELERKRAQVLNKVRTFLKRERFAGLPSLGAEMDDLVAEINAAEPEREAKE